jgi:DHA1 family inner membrane transport protein
MVVAAIFALTFGAVWALVPWQPGNAAATMRNELKAFGRLQVWFTLLIGSVGFGGLFAVFSFAFDCGRRLAKIGAPALTS